MCCVLQDAERSRVNELMNEVTSHEVGGDNDGNILDGNMLLILQITPHSVNKITKEQ